MRNMGEIDTKPIEPVQVALTLFGEKGAQRKHQSSSGSSEEMEREKDVEGLSKDLAHYKVQLEAKDSAYLQQLHELEHSQKTAEELSFLLKNCEAERDAYIEECREARFRVDELELKVKEMADQLLETAKVREQLSHAMTELKATQGELLRMETDLATAGEVELKALAKAKLMEDTANIEKERAEDLLKHVAELNEAIVMSKLAAAEAEKEKCEVLSEKDAEIEFAREAAAARALEQAGEMKRQLEMIPELENQLMSKSVFIDSLQMELNKANELLNTLDKAVSDAVTDLNWLKEELRVKEKENSDQTFYVGALETELNQLKLELKNANDEASHLNCDIQALTNELEKARIEVEEAKEKENEVQIEVALLKSELHKSRSKLAAAEAAEARAGSVKSGLYLAVQQLAFEAEEAKRENQRLKQVSDKEAEDSDDLSLVAVQVSQINESKQAATDGEDQNERKITISLEEYESLYSLAEKAGRCQAKDSESKIELEVLKKELEVATARIAEFRTRAEQAATRAEAAERGKMVLQGQVDRWKEQKQKRKAALAALREECSSRQYSPPAHDSKPRTYQPLFKVLDMKF